MPLFPCTIVKIASAARRVAVLRPRPAMSIAGAAAIRPRIRTVAKACRDVGAPSLLAAVPTATPADAPALPTGGATEPTAAHTGPTASHTGPMLSGLGTLAGGDGGGAPGGSTTAPAPEPEPVMFQIAGPLLFAYPGPIQVPPGGDTPGCCGTHMPEVPAPIPTDVPAPALGVTFVLGAILLVSLRRMRRRG